MGVTQQQADNARHSTATQCFRVHMSMHGLIWHERVTLYLSALHCKISATAGELYLQGVIPSQNFLWRIDFNSTAVRASGRLVIHSWSMFDGQHPLRLMCRYERELATILQGRRGAFVFSAALGAQRAEYIWCAALTSLQHHMSMVARKSHRRPAAPFCS